MKTTLYFLFLFLPFLAKCQHQEVADYHQRLEECRQAMTKNKSIGNPDGFVMKLRLP